MNMCVLIAALLIHQNGEKDQMVQKRFAMPADVSTFTHEFRFINF